MNKTVLVILKYLIPALQNIQSELRQKERLDAREISRQEFDGEEWIDLSREPAPTLSARKGDPVVIKKISEHAKHPGAWEDLPYE